MIKNLSMLKYYDFFYRNLAEYLPLSPPNLTAHYKCHRLYLRSFWLDSYIMDAFQQFWIHKQF